MIVEKRELIFLLSCRGCRTCPEAFEPEASPDPEEILEGLFQKGWLENRNSFFQVQEPLAGAVSQIAGAKRILSFCPGNPRRELMFLYPGEVLLAVQESFRRKNALRLVFLEKEELPLFLEEQGLLGEEEWEPRPCPEETKALLPEKPERREELEEWPWIRMLVEQTDGQTGETLEQMAVLRKGLEDVMVTALSERAEDGSRENYRIEPYEEKKFTDRILQWMEQEEG